MWAKTKSSGKAGFDKVYGWVDKLGPPVNRLSNKLGSEAFWPTTLDKESDKAARILQSFCKDGFYVEEDRPSTTDVPNPNSKQRVVKKIPAEVIKNAKGLAIFTTMRTGLWVSGAGGSGVLVARKEDGTWSPPSGLMLHTAGLGFLVGVDIYDCVLVINSQDALDAFTKIRCTLGGEVSAVAGPVGVGGVLETEVHKRQAPIFTYLKSRGFYAGVQIDGTVVIERTDENERFYNERIGAKDILAGKVRHTPYEVKKLLQTIKAAQGDTDVDESLLPNEPAPGDYEIEPSEEKTFGIPDVEDPDPYGVLALQNAGLEIKEAGTNKRPTSEQFEFKPSPTSPVYATFNRFSMDGRSNSRRSSWRTSTISSVIEPKTPTMVDMCTQTDDLDTPSTVKSPTSPPPLPPRHITRTPSPVLENIPEIKTTEEVTPQAEKTKEIKPEELQASSPSNKQKNTKDNKHDSDEEFDDESDDEEPVIQEIHQAAAPQVITRARVVQVAKPIPPKLPVRNPFRNRISVNSDVSSDMRDASAGPSPMVGNPSPPPTPSLKNDDSSASSLSSIEGEGLEHVSDKLQPKNSNDQTPEKTQEKDEFHSLPESPIKSIPGGFN